MAELIASPQTEGNPPVQVTVFAKNDCGRCKTTSSAFAKAGVVHRYLNVEESTEPRAEFADADGSPRTPRDYVVQEIGLAMPAVQVRHAETGELLLEWLDMNPARISEVKAGWGVLGHRFDLESGELVPDEA